MVFLWTHSIREAVESASMVLMVFTALTACTVFNLWRRADLPDPPVSARASAGLFVVAQLGIILVGFSMSKLLTLEVAAFVIVGLAAYLWSKPPTAKRSSSQ